MRTLALAALLFVAEALAAPGVLWLAPGKSVTVFDAADPTVRLVISAPPDAPLDLAPLLELKADESVHSMATRVQVRGASALAPSGDGGVALAPTSGRAAHGPMLEGGVLVRERGVWRLHASEPAQPALRHAADNTPATRTLISKPGATTAQAERDIRQCRAYADAASAQFLRSSAKVAAYNNVMQACLRNFGYTIHSPAA